MRGNNNILIKDAVLLKQPVKNNLDKVSSQMHILLHIFIIIFCIFTSTQLFSVDIAWIQRYNGVYNGNDVATAIAVDGSGNVYVTGYVDGLSRINYATIKYNSNGVLQWVQEYIGPEYCLNFARAIAVDGLGNVYVTGESKNPDIDTCYDYVTIKYNTDGVQQWVQRYNGPYNSHDYPSAIAVDNAGNVYVTGRSIGSATGYTNYDYATIKYNTDGVLQWVQRYNGPINGWDQATAIAVDGSGNVYVTGSIDGYTIIDYATIKYNTDGVMQWVQIYNGPANGIDYANAIAVDGLGNVYVTGFSETSGIYDDDYATIKYNTDGVMQWVQRYGTADGSDRSNAIAVDGLGNVYVTGRTVNIGTYEDYTTIKYNTNGVLQWTQNYNGPVNGNDCGHAIGVDGSNNVYVTGRSDGINYSYDYATIGYNSNGVQQWLQRYEGPGNSVDWPMGIAVDGLGNVYVTGYSTGSGTYYDYATIKYVPDLDGDAGIDEIDMPDTVEVCHNVPVYVTVKNFSATQTLPPCWYVYVEIKQGGQTIARESLHVNTPMAPGEMRVFVFNIHFDRPCNHMVYAFTAYPNDVNPDNDIMEKSVVAAVHDPFEITHLSISPPPESLYYHVCQWVIFDVVVHNNNHHVIDSMLITRVYFDIIKPDYTVIRDSQDIDALAPCHSTTLWFPTNGEIHLDMPGRWYIDVYPAGPIPGDSHPENNYRDSSFYVISIGSISGTKFYDYNNNGERDPEDIGLSGWLDNKT